jgi:hypothetical protein
MAARRAAAALCLLALACWPSGAAGQLKFSELSGPEYITYCAEAASTQILTPGCTDGYQLLVDVVQSLLRSPMNFSKHELGTLNQLCSASEGAGTSCVSQMQNLAELYVDGLPAPSPASSGRDTCEGTLAPNAKPLFATTLPFVCLSDGEGGSCLVEVAKALERAGACVAADSTPRPGI